MLEIYKDKRVFVTGHTGFKGSWLLAILEQVGAQYAGFGLAPYTVPSLFNILCKTSNSTIGDIRDAAVLKSSMQAFQPEIVFHLAAQPLVRASYRNPTYTYETNVIGTLNLLEAIRECASVKAVVIITTDKVYDNKEWIYPYRENDALGGYDIYSSSKACAEILVQSYQKSFFNLDTYRKQHNVLIASARAGNVIGGGDWSDDRLIPDIVKAAATHTTTQIRNPKAVRPWQHVLDCLYGYLLLGEKLLEQQSDFANPWNFAPHSFESKTVGEVVDLAKSIWQDISVEFGTPPDNFHEAGLLKLDNTKAISLLKWTPQWDTITAISKTIEWYKAYYSNKEILTQQHIEEYFSTMKYEV
jgi:CDP-glucose 4,6-dehydratase